MMRKLIESLKWTKNDSFGVWKIHSRFIISLQTCQRDIKKLKEKELQLQVDLSSASKEILRLRSLLKEYGSEGSIV